MAGILFHIEPYATVPNVYDMTQINAGSTISGVGLTVGTVSTDYNETITAGNVYNQNPNAGVRIPLGDPVNLDVSLGSAEVTEDATYYPGVIDDVGRSDNNNVYTGTGYMHLTTGSRGWARWIMTIPQGATINSAYMDFWMKGNQSTQPSNNIIWARDHGNSARPTLTTHLRYADPVSPGGGGWLLTTANVSWNPHPNGDWIVVTTPNVSTVVQEIVNRGDWSSGNAICFAFLNYGGNDYRQFYSDDNCELRVNYTYTP